MFKFYAIFLKELGVCDYPYNVDCINPRPLQPEYTGPSQEIPQPGWVNNYPYNIQRVHSGKDLQINV